MRRHGSRWFVGVVGFGAAMAFGACAPVAARAQVLPAPQSAPAAHAAEMAALRRSIDSLMPILQQHNRRDSVRREAQEQKETRTERTEPLDSLQLGPFKIVGSRSAIRRSARDARAAWNAVAPLFSRAGGDAPPVTIIAEVVGVPRNVAVRIKPEDPVVTLLQDRRPLWQYNYERAMGLVLSRRLPAAVRGWLMGEGIATAQNLDWVYRAIALPVPLAKEHRNAISGTCMNGDVRDCRSLLGIEPPFHATVDPILRASFITYIAARSRSGAISSSTTDTSALIPALERIGGAPIDDLIKDWRRYVIEERPRGFADFGRVQAAILFWVVVCAALATRSTRWRLG